MMYTNELKNNISLYTGRIPVYDTYTYTKDRITCIRPHIYHTTSRFSKSSFVFLSDRSWIAFFGICDVFFSFFLYDDMAELSGVAARRRQGQGRGRGRGRGRGQEEKEEEVVPDFTEVGQFVRDIPRGADLLQCKGERPLPLGAPAVV
ncbi:uncharacterized protein LOC110894979 isoform X2 [Helianthus annuus]|uniref:uncharacterized protein LOC110894979 isoform X2 n=1 Tax=Helianthus annuus TaxID=4232 RepID=UPI000B8F149A|nr:uncharacterized protein LOC110894979 isoform X2 [Helianthus annuus]